jgi:hypothetical protein
MLLSEDAVGPEALEGAADADAAAAVAAGAVAVTAPAVKAAGPEGGTDEDAEPAAAAGATGAVPALATGPLPESSALLLDGADSLPRAGPPIAAGALPGTSGGLAIDWTLTL